MIGVARQTGGTRIDLFVRASNWYAYHASMNDGLTLGGWAQVPGLAVLGSPTAVWNAANTEMDVFGIDARLSTVYRDRFYSNGTTSGWVKLTGISG